MPPVEIVPVTAPVATPANSPTGVAGSAAAHAAAVADRPMKRLSLMTGWTRRAADYGAATAMLIASGRVADGAVWSELLGMQQAVWRQLYQQGEALQQGAAELAQEWAELKGANTLSKLAEQDFNLTAQFGQLFSQQATNLVTLMESVQVGYSYWVSEKLRDF